MKTFKTFILYSLLMTFAAAASAAQKAAPAANQNKKINFAKDVDGLGGNEALMDMAENLKPETKSRIVQDRIVERRNTVEFGVSYGGIEGGTTYLQTQAVGFSMDWHITPHWSIGGRYYDFNSQLTPEGERVFNEARANYAANNRTMIVDIDTPHNAKMAVLNWYPVYGKLNLFDAAVAQFDMYLLVGGGQMELDSGNSPLYTAGGGVGLWMSKHITARAEVRYQGYKDQVVTGERNINSVVGSIGLGLIL
jgi:outer membrane beta-barrel protein